MSKLAFKTKLKLGIGAFLCLFGLIAFGSTFRWINLNGDYRVVWQKYSGVSETIGGDGIHPYIGLITTPHKYYIGTDTFIVDDKTVNADNDYMDDEENRFNMPDAAPIEIPVKMLKLSEEAIAAGETSGPTNVKISCTMQFHIDPTYLVKLHNTKTKSYRTNFISPIMTKTLNDLITPMDARSVYQGDSRIVLQGEIQNALMNNPDFKENGVVVELFVLKEVEFVDKKFHSQITRESRANQEKNTAKSEMVAHEAKAKSAEAAARSEQNKRLVEAETLKGEKIAEAEAEKAKRVLAAEAQREEARLEGEGIRLKKVAEADGVLALGKATAEAKRLQLEAYQGEGGQRFAAVEIARSMGEGIEKIYLPAVPMTTISKDFHTGLSQMLPGYGDSGKSDNK